MPFGNEADRCVSKLSSVGTRTYQCGSNFDPGSMSIGSSTLLIKNM